MMAMDRTGQVKADTPFRHSNDSGRIMCNVSYFGLLVRYAAMIHPAKFPTWLYMYYSERENGFIKQGNKNKKRTMLKQHFPMHFCGC